MLSKDEKILMSKVTEAVGKLLDKMSEKWTAREISEVTKIPPTRLTEYKDFEKYQRNITVTYLINLISEGFFTLEDIIKTANGLTDEDKKYLREMNFYENVSFRKLVVKNRKAGIDPVEAQSLLDEISSRGVDVMELLRRAKDNT